MSTPFWKSAGGAAVISSIGGLGSGTFSGLFSAGAQRRQYKYNLRLQRQQQDWQKYMWDLQNRYSLPVNEISRLVEAGVNPAVAFSNAGAGPAPVPQSGSAGGVSAPTAEMPNIGASAVAAAQNAQRVENETNVANSQSDKNEAEAEYYRKQAGLSGVIKDYNEFNLGIDRQLRDVTIGNRSLAYDFGKLRYAMGYQDYVRGEIYTTNFPAFLNQRMEINRQNIRLMEKSIDRIDAEVSLLQSQKQLTDDQAKVVRQKLVCAQYDAWMARFNQGIYEDATKGSYYDGDRNMWFPLRQKFVETLQNHISEQLSRSETGLLEAGLDQSFQSEYGDRLRFYNFETVRRGANLTRSRIWNGTLQSIYGMGMMAISAGNLGSTVKFRNQMVQRWNQTARDFHLEVPHFSGGNIMIPPIYSPYGPVGGY